MTTKEIAKEIKDTLKPLQKEIGLKLSIQTEYKHISVYIMELKENPILNDEFYEKYGYCQINHYYIKDNERLTITGKTIFSMINTIINKYHYDNSDIMTDYFDTNFYISFGVGRFDKQFKLAS